MGALHAGHLALVDEARRRADVRRRLDLREPDAVRCKADLAAYPRTLEADLAACRGRGVDASSLPTERELYPDGHQTWIEVTELALPLCGASRPGHFRGVATVVAKLLIAARPHVAVFGEKDFQQLALVRRMARDLGLGVEIVGAADRARERRPRALEPQREPVGGRAPRGALPGARARRRRERDGAPASGAATPCSPPPARRSPRRRSHALDYAELRDPASLAPAPERLAAPTLLALAAFLPHRNGQGEVRLIDNRVLPVQPEEDRS